MTDSSTLTTLAGWLAGAFDNRPQAQEQPTWFVHLRWWHRPVPHRIYGNLALFAEQANALFLNQPYRQRVMLLQELEPEVWQAQYWALKQPEHFRGAGANADRLRQLHTDDLEPLPGCVLTITAQSDYPNTGIAAHRFEAKPPPNACCYFQYEGQTRQVVLGFQVSAQEFWSYDRGVDPETGQALWGALMGPYEFTKCQDFSGELPL